MRAILAVSVILAVGVPRALATYGDVACSVDDRNLKLNAFFFWGTEGRAAPEGQMELRVPSLSPALRKLESLTPQGKRLWRLWQHWQYGDEFKAQIALDIGEGTYPESANVVIDTRRLRSSEYTGKYVLTMHPIGGNSLTFRGSVRCTVPEA